jgi:tRNA-2-methylthio-N6-dimethylallyladenosine synthase
LKTTNYMDSLIQSVKKFTESKDSPPLAHVHNFGCQLNFSDGEKIKGILMKLGYGFTETYDNADIIIFNTCAVRESAEEKAFGVIGSVKRYKEKKPDLIIGLCGCMAVQEHVVERVKKSFPFIDIVFGTSAIDELPKLLLDVFNGKKHVFDTSEYNKPLSEQMEVVRDSSFKASVPIMYGCNNFCTYCIVPYVRGRERSRNHEAIIAEIKGLVSDGYKEIMLLGQNVNSYGNDLANGISFSELLRRLNEIDGEFVIRFMSSHPKDASFELIDTIIQCEKVAKHLHLPVQSGSNEILKAMNRKYTIEKYLEIVDYARQQVPDFSFTTDVIVGFPNETEEQFNETLEILKRVKYDNIYSFIYSKRSGTRAALFEDNVNYEEKSRRMQTLLALQREISIEGYKRFIGRTMTVLVDDECKNAEGWIHGKSNEFIIVEFKGPKELVGQFVKVKIIGSKNWAVIGEIID